MHFHITQENIERVKRYILHIHCQKEGIKEERGIVHSNHFNLVDAQNHVNVGETMHGFFGF